MLVRINRAMLVRIMTVMLVYNTAMLVKIIMTFII